MSDIHDQAPEPANDPGIDPVPASTDAPGDLLRRYLAASDAACPGCGYNLRGATSDACPECGQALALGVEQTSALAGRRGLLVLLLVWLLAAGAFNGIRAGKAIMLSGTPAQQFLITTGPTGSITFSGSVTPTGSPSMSNIVIPSGAAASPGRALPPNTRIIGSSGGALVGAMVPSTIQGTQTQITLNPAPATFAWSNVGALQWADLGWWSVVAVAAITGLVLVIVYRKRSAPMSVRRTLALIAWLGFAGWFAYHTVNLTGVL